MKILDLKNVKMLYLCPNSLGLSERCRFIGMSASHKIEKYLV